MDERYIPYVMICRDVFDMENKRQEIINAFRKEIKSVSRVNQRIDFNDGTILLLITEKRFTDVWRQGRVYRIVGERGRIYRGLHPVKQ